MRAMKKLFAAGLALIGTLLLLDLYLQLAGIQTPMETRIDPTLGPTYIPNKNITHFNEGFFVGAANKYGYMGPAIPPRSQGSERRILLIGDSYVLGHTVLPRHHFGRFLETNLSLATGKEVHALNFGKADFNLRNMYQYFIDFAGTFDHDVALFFVGAGDLAPARQVVSSLYPAVELQGDSLIIDRNFHNSRTYHFYKAIEPVFTNSAILRLVFNAYKMISGGGLADVVLDKFAPRPAASAQNETLSPRALPELNRAILNELAKDPRNILVIREDLDPSLRAEVRSSGMPIIDLAAFLDSLEAKGNDPYYWPVTRMRGHWNHAAHRSIGEFLADQLQSIAMICTQKNWAHPSPLSDLRWNGTKTRSR